MKLLVQRREPVPDPRRAGKKVTYGTLSVDDAIECGTLEDEIREVAGRPVSEWKIHGETAIPSGDFDLGLVNSPAHGVDTMRLQNVPGYDCVDIHSGVDIDSTLGCIIVGDTIDEGNGRISGGLAHQVLAKLKEKVIRAMSRGEKVTIEIRNPA